MFEKDGSSPTGEAAIASPRVVEESDPSTLVGHTLGDRYRLDRMLGHGGMGAVYAATGPGNASVAVKVVLGDHRKPESLRRFVREAKTATAIDSPHVVRVLEVEGDTARNVPYIVMELLRGEDLERTIRKHGALDQGLVARLFVQACQGLAAVHARGVVHRDIKPANIFLHEEDGGRITAKICDFGIAKHLQRELDANDLASTDLTHTGSVIGSPPYMSPEQARSSKDIDARSDVWSLGAALFEALAGQRVWEGRASLGELMAAIIGETVPRLDDVAPWVDPKLADVVARALEKDRNRRFADMNAFAAALEPFAIPEDALTTSAIRPLPEERRSARPAPAIAGTSAQFAASGAVATTRNPASIVVPIAIVALLGVGGGVFALTMKSPPPAPPVATSPAVPSATASAIAPAPSPSPAISVEPVVSASASASASSAKPAAPKPTVTKKKPNADPNVPNIF